MSRHPYDDDPLPINPIEAPQRPPGTRGRRPASTDDTLVTPLDRVPYVPFDYQRYQVDRRPKGRLNTALNESPKAHYAFLIYCSLGPSRRSQQAVLNHLVTEGKLSPKSIRQIFYWAKRYAWQERVKEYDAAVIEKEREEWDRDRVARLQARAVAAGEGYDEAVSLVIEKLKAARAGTGKVPFEAVVQAVKILADVEYRDRNDLTEHVPEASKGGAGITITIDTYAKDAAPLPPGPSTQVTPLALPPPATVEGQVRELPAPDQHSAQRSAQHLYQALGLADLEDGADGSDD